jgi:hypothetical protein
MMQVSVLTTLSDMAVVTTMLDMAAVTTKMTMAGGVAAKTTMAGGAAATMMTAGGAAAAAEKVAKEARALASRARDLESPERDLLEADLGGAQRLAMMIGATAAVAAAAAPASPARDGESKKSTVLVPTCALRRSRGNESSIRGEHQGTGKNWSSNSLQHPHVVFSDKKRSIGTASCL